MVFLLLLVLPPPGTDDLGDHGDIPPLFAPYILGARPETGREEGPLDAGSKVPNMEQLRERDLEKAQMLQKTFDVLRQLSSWRASAQNRWHCR